MNSQITLLNWPTRGATVRMEGASGGCFLHCQTQVLSEVVVIPCTYILATPKPVAGTLLQKGPTPPTLLPTDSNRSCLQPHSCLPNLPGVPVFGRHSFASTMATKEVCKQMVFSFPVPCSWERQFEGDRNGWRLPLNLTHHTVLLGSCPSEQ